MVYDTKTSCLLNGKKIIKLAKLEQKLLISLASKRIINYNEITNYIYNKNFEDVKAPLRGLIRRFRLKTGIKIKPMYSVGYILKEDIFFR
jgi:DNA-binding response OmpR family regulator